MATSNRDVTLKLSVETLGEDGIKELQKAVEALGRDGGAAAPEFQKLADEIGRLGEQSQALTTFRELSEETDKLAARQADAAASAAQMAERLEVLRAATAAATQRQKEANAELLQGQRAQAEATAALRLLKAEYDAAGKNTAEYRARLQELVDRQNAANVALVDLRANQKAANAEASKAESAQSKLETQYKKSAAQVERLDDALRKQNEALRNAATAAETLGVSTTDVAAAEGKLLATLQAGVATVNQRTQSIREMTEADRLLAIEEKAVADLLARGQAALQAETLAQRDAARAVEQYTAAKTEAMARAAAQAAATEAAQATWQREAEALVNAAHAAQQLARETEILTAAQRELANQNAFEKQAAEAQKLLQAAQYVKFWEQALQDAEAQAKQTADAFQKLGVRSMANLQKEITDTRAAMTTLAAESQRTGTSMAGAFAAGENKIKVLEREIRELTGTLTTADKAAGLFKNSMGQIAAGNLIADAIGSIVEKVKDMGRQFVASVVQLDTFRRAMNAVYKDTALVASQLEFLRKTATDGGVGVGGLSDSFIKFSASMKSANVPVQQSNELFASLTRAAGSLGLGAERTSLALDALGQIASKGVVSMEELRQQLGDSLPGALSLTAKGLGITDAELVKLVESGNLAARDFFPAFTKGLKELHGTTEGLVPTWERFKNLLTLSAQNAGDAGGIQIMNAALKLLAGTVGFVANALNILVEVTGLAAKALALLGPGLGTASERFAMFKEEVAAATERQTKFREALAATLNPVQQQATAVAALTTKVQETIASTDGLTASQKLAAVAVKLTGDATLDAAAKYVQLSIASATLIKQQENETVNLEKIAKARKEEGDTLIQLAKLRGDEQGVLIASKVAAESYALATAAVAASKREELAILEQQLASQLKKLEADKATNEQKEKETEKLRELIKTKTAEVEQTRAATAAAEQDIAVRRLAVQTYGDQSAKVEEYTKRVAELAAKEAELTMLEQAGFNVAESLKIVREDLAAATARQRDAVNDLIAANKLEYQAKIQNVEATRSALDSESKLYAQLAANAKARGDLQMATYYETEAKRKSIEVAKLSIEIKRIELELEKAELQIKIDNLDKNDVLYAQRLKELQLRQQMNDIRMGALGAEKELLRLKSDELSITNSLSGALGKEASARGDNTQAISAESAARERLLSIKEREISLTERDLNLKQKERELETRKRMDNVMAPIDNVPTFSSQEEADVWLEEFKKAYRENNTTSSTSGPWGSYLYELAMAEYEAEVKNLKQKAEVERRKRENEGKEPTLPGSLGGGTTTTPTGGSGAPSDTGGRTGGSSSSGGVSGGRNLTVNIGGRPGGTISGLNEQQSRETLAVLRQLETFQGTAQ
jgi:tape measure domain-containing protein